MTYESKHLKRWATAVALVLSASATYATEGMLPSGYLGDWCVMNSDEKTTSPPWNHIAYRKKIVGPCQNVLAIGKTSIRQGKDNCKIDDNLRTMVRTQLIRYTCKNGTKGFVQIVIENASRSETGLDMLYIDYAVDQSYWDEQEKALRPQTQSGL
jgi:hypothetical protein